MIKKLIQGSHCVIVVGDARFGEFSLDKTFIERLKHDGKPFIIVLNKSDLIHFDYAKNQKLQLEKQFSADVVFVSAKKRYGTGLLRKIIKHNLFSSYDKYEIEKFYVAVVGYPNVGKSSLINALVGRHVAGTSVKAGFTKGIQKIKLSSKIYLYDTPGVIKIKDRFIELLLGSVDINKLNDDIDYYAELLIKLLNKINPELLINVYGVNTLDDIANKFNKVKKANTPDLIAAARIVLKDWISGKIKFAEFDPSRLSELYANKEKENGNEKDYE